jgi:hypothetical protein
VQTFGVGLLARRGSVEVPSPRSRQELQREFYERSSKWLGTSVVTWSIWALTGMPMGLPHVTWMPQHHVISAGIWPAYIMIGGLADLGRRARMLYAQPLIDTALEDTEPD